MEDAMLIKQRNLNAKAKLSSVKWRFAVKTTEKLKTQVMKNEYLHTNNDAAKRFQFINNAEKLVFE